MGGMIFGLGIGTFILIFLSLISTLLCVVSSRTRGSIGPISVCFTLIVFLILFFIPRSEESLSAAYKSEYPLFIWRLCLLAFLVLSTVGGFIFVVTDSIKALSVGRRQLWRCHQQRQKSFNIADNTEFVEKVINSRVPVIVNFHADWCDPCHILTPKLRAIADASEDLHLAIIDVEANPELVHTFEVKAVPAVLAIRNGLVVDKFIGLVDADLIDGMIGRLRGDAPKDTTIPI